MEIIRNFGIQPVLLLAQIVNFLIILYLLQKFFYKPIVKLLEQRKKRIEESLKNADLIEEKLKKTQEQSVQILAEAQKNSQALIASAKGESEKIISQATLEARKQLEEILTQSQVQIEAQRKQMQKQLEKETLNLVVEVVRKVLERTLKPKERQDLTTKAVSEIEKQIS
ncbi:ATP synthase F0 subunit B [Candidatus Curtissbacteria bacterium RIFCSPLOWO2_01_FULL_41_28]|uniref:ATP synthase subunit b n=1 Tax=Candidatus Curtissbacteria bacterium RIFOXYA1_FULL_41_14 TaxID=1797737 RepID=A0A1F5HBC2_9BACT|nr:MAG: ATP synthase subunit b [Candidatus Curtissbacteria bacterium GW2011_GWD1_40_8]OGD94974.1 MAG: ATP synthase F0 subunit B [Candidatus Curtissbacteria bacterium RIFCSPLOWO2_01_FULL_41_28]OGE01380.1 MAG: ATP synthase F0 subunit B [Candidatus Curtissbacteria bacterium RIFOXYA1_FULL_41_14]OGE10071.1 MAG: ATP synthase F0 subunit B [Candidatus Curtissbacteria bacterium RIFOXYC2_FULL_41_11]OGE16798.1 MAG: ATP synthase F0 subunit B [Candidatus Curtissbacteria bacterium RIFOXYC12_FULL_41_11]